MDRYVIVVTVCHDEGKISSRGILFRVTGPYPEKTALAWYLRGPRYQPSPRMLADRNWAMSSIRAGTPVASQKTVLAWYSGGRDTGLAMNSGRPKFGSQQHGAVRGQGRLSLAEKKWLWPGMRRDQNFVPPLQNQGTSYEKMV